MSHILILDIGKTNKKAFVFNKDYHIVFEKSEVFPETIDDDGDPCENLCALTEWIKHTADEICSHTHFQINAFNVSAYGASFVHLDENGEPVAPLYNYLKPFPDDLKRQFFDTYGSEEKMALETASPVLGHLNSGLQLYWLKYRKPLIFNRIKWSLHLPQYVAFLVGKKLGLFENPAEAGSDITGIGCHTMLWDFRKNDYHDWVKEEGIAEKFPSISSPSNGLHDSSAALVPYLASFEGPFVLLSTGTWCISMNPFNFEPLTSEELKQDCLCYLSYTGKPVKAARYFGGKEHEEAVKNRTVEFGGTDDFFTKIDSCKDPTIKDKYTSFMHRLVEKQVASTRLAIGKTQVKKIFVDGGFSKNEIFMTLLANAFKDYEVYAAEVAQATAIGAALAIHASWNGDAVPQDLMKLRKIEP